MKIFQLIDLIIKLFKLNKRSKVVLLFLVPTFLLGQNNGAFWLGKRTTGAPTNLLLDDYPGAAAAYSVRKLDKDYTGFAMEIRRQSDNATQNIGFVGENLDVTSINTFCSGTTCTVRTWYDQSGNGRNAVQATAINQPTIYASGNVILENTKPAISFDGSNDFFNISTISIASLNQSCFFVFKKTINLNFVGFSEITGYDYSLLILNNILYYSGSGNQWRGFPYILSTQNLTTVIDNLSTAFLYANGLQVSQTSTGAYGASSNIYNVIGLRSSIYYSNGTKQELILYFSDLTSTRTSIETNINTYYSIY